MVIEGVIEEIKYRNENNGYTVGKLNTYDGTITVVGYAAFIKLEETVSLEGELVYHDRFGEQFEFSSINIVVPSTIKGIENYLASGLIPNIGPKTAKKIVDRFGIDSLDIIQFNPERLKEIDGIGDKKLQRIIEAYDEQREIRDIMVYLQQFDISTNYGIKIYKKYGNETIRVINENPYKLSEDVYGIGFKIADSIAEKMGINKASPYRTEAGLKYIMHNSASEGHCYLPLQELMQKGMQLLAVEEENVEDGIKSLALNQTFFLTNMGEEKIIYYMPYHQAENNVARKLVELSRTELDQQSIDIRQEIEKIEKADDISFGNKQKMAIEEAINNGLLVITGGPGTGKTTIINAIIQICQKIDLNVVLAAPTGRAAKRMTETTGIESKTIHRLLELSMMTDDMEFGKDEDDPIDADLIIIDEASMIDILLMNNLIRAINPGTRLILVGDIDQLPSVGAGNVLKDIINSGMIKIIMLDEIFRQAEESMIIINAHKINKGESPVVNARDKDFFFISSKNKDEILENIISLNLSRLPNFYGFDPINDIQVLSPMKKGELGINQLNNSLQEALNPKAKGKNEKQLGSSTFRVGDKVMQMRNNYDLEWEIIEDGMLVDSGKGVFNGDFGYIEEIDTEESLLKIIFDEEKLVEYDFKQLDDIKLAYATTVHKSQGSEFPVIIMPMVSGPPMLMTRNLLYTAITRAKNLVVLVGEERYMYMMIKNNIITNRYSSLDKKIRDFFEMFYG